MPSFLNAVKPHYVQQYVDVFGGQELSDRRPLAPRTFF